MSEEYSDAAKRCSGIVNQHLADDKELALNSWVAIRLSDGSSDGALYPDKFAAIDHQLHESQCAYIHILPGGLTPRIAESLLRSYRQLYENDAMRSRLIETTDELIIR